MTPDPRSRLLHTLDHSSPLVETALPRAHDPVAVRAALRRLVGVTRRARHLGYGGDPLDVTPVTDPVADDAWPVVWAVEITIARWAWRPPEAPRRHLVFRGAQMTAARALDLLVDDLAAEQAHLAMLTRSGAW